MQNTIFTLASSDFELGCYVDMHDDRDLTLIANNDWHIPRLCASLCHNQGYKYSGMQYFSECWCGNTYGSKY